MGDTISVPECSGVLPEAPEKSYQARMFRLVAQCELGKLEMLLRNRMPYIDLNGTNEVGDTPLHIAARVGDLPICKLLTSVSPAVAIYELCSCSSH